MDAPGLGQQSHRCDCIAVPSNDYMRPYSSSELRSKSGYCLTWFFRDASTKGKSLEKFPHISLIEERKLYSRKMNLNMSRSSHKSKDLEKYSTYDKDQPLIVRLWAEQLPCAHDGLDCFVSDIMCIRWHSNQSQCRWPLLGTLGTCL